MSTYYLYTLSAYRNTGGKRVRILQVRPVWIRRPSKTTESVCYLPVNFPTFGELPILMHINELLRSIVLVVYGVFSESLFYFFRNLQPHHDPPPQGPVTKFLRGVENLPSLSFFLFFLMIHAFFWQLIDKWQFADGPRTLYNSCQLAYPNPPHSLKASRCRCHYCIISYSVANLPVCVLVSKYFVFRLKYYYVHCGQ